MLSGISLRGLKLRKSNTMEVRSIPTVAQKAKLKKLKEVPEVVKVAVYDGCSNPGGSVQFHRDVILYGLYEAILYIAEYEEEGKYFTEGTASKAMVAACAWLDNTTVIIHRGWPGDGSGEDDLADYNANEADDYQHE